MRVTQVTTEALKPSLDGVDVCVDEPGVQHAARQIDHRSVGPAPGAEVSIHRRNATVDHGNLHRLRLARNANAAQLPADALGKEDVCRTPDRKVGVGKGRERLGYALTS